MQKKVDDISNSVDNSQNNNNDIINSFLEKYYDSKQEPVDLVKMLSQINNLLIETDENNEYIVKLLNIIMQEIIGLNTEMNCKNDNLVESSTKRVIAESMLSYLNKIEYEIINNSRSKLKLHQKVTMMLEKYLMTNYFKKILLITVNEDHIENVYGDDYTLSKFILEIALNLTDKKKELERLVMIYQNIIDNSEISDFKILNRKYLEDDKKYTSILYDFWKSLNNLIGVKKCEKIINNIYNYSNKKKIHNNENIKPLLNVLKSANEYICEDYKKIIFNNETYYGASITTLIDFDYAKLEKFLNKLLRNGYHEEAKYLYDYISHDNNLIKKNTLFNVFKDLNEELSCEFNNIFNNIDKKICIGHILLTEPTKDVITEDGNINFILKMVMKSIYFMSEILLINEHEFQDFQKETLEALKQISKLRDLETANHMKRVTIYTQILAEELLRKKNNNEIDKIIKKNNINNETDYYIIEKEYIRDLLYSASLHDLGKVGIHDDILKSKKKLTKEQYEIMKLHSVYGYQRLSSITKMNKKKSFLELASILAGNHHEKWDGSGYPNEKKGYEIPLSSRILAIADVYDALRVKRSYKKEYSHEEAVETIVKNKNINFDPILTDIFYEINKKFDKAFIENKNNR